jgi:hypothetical protein
MQANRLEMTYTPYMVGYHMIIGMVDVLRALGHLHMMRGFDMAPSEVMALRLYTRDLLRKRVCPNRSLP